MSLHHTCVFLMIFCTVGLVLVFHQLYLSSRTLAELQLRLFKDFAEGYELLYDPALKTKVVIQLKAFLKRDESFLRNTVSWHRLGTYMEEYRIYTSIAERGSYSPETVSPEALHLECEELLKIACDNTFSFLDSPETTREKAERVLRELHQVGAFLPNDPAYTLLEVTLAQKIRLFMFIPLRREYYATEFSTEELLQAFKEKVVSCGFLFEDILRGKLQTISI